MTAPEKTAPSTEAIRRVERWLLRRGVPQFIAGYSASEDVLTRMLPLLTFVFLAELLSATSLDWPWWANLLAPLGGLAILLGGWATVNVLRGRRPLQRPDRVGAVEMAVFVVVPALVPLVFGAHAGEAAVTAGQNLVVLGLAYAATSYGVVPMTRWALGRVVRELGATVDLLARALPLLLLFATVLFLTAEVWDVAGELRGGYLVATVLLFVAMGTLFLVVRLPRELADLTRFETWEDVRSLVAGTPAAPLAPAEAPEGGAPPLTRRQRGNLALVLLFSQGVQILLVSVLLGAFFVAFGLVVMTEGVVRSWTGGAPHVLASFHVLDRQVLLSEELLRVATFIAAFSGLYFCVYAITDPTYRGEFYEGIEREMRENLAVRTVYLAAPSHEADA